MNTISPCLKFSGPTVDSSILRRAPPLFHNSSHHLQVTKFPNQKWLTSWLTVKATLCLLNNEFLSSEYKRLVSL
ncbi:hypothetical protein BpHYR1_012203 [Brachionus plicatilis]|uniref:Uncharacterized protein n=1 Tax=Brachionus plicatilis TaxID=10195 RepID=A0A3M7RED1_BRAPC|nr:hypothetical protein BpHYR1_012203 [Brachionus plicatilis]